MIDIDKAITTAVKTGKVSFGANSAIKNAKTGKVKLIILTSNCPRKVREDVEYYCKLSKVPLVIYKGSSIDLAALCSKPFLVSAVSIREPGDSEVLEFIGKPESEEYSGGSE